MKFVSVQRALTSLVHKLRGLAMAVLGTCAAGGLVLGMSLSALQCRKRDDSSGTFPRDETLYVGGSQWGEPSSFNPLASSPDWPVKSFFELMYETLFVYDALSGELRPLLAESYRRTGSQLEISLRSSARWSDGRPLTADDVKYTLEMGRRYKGAPAGPLWAYLEDVKILDADAEAPRELAIVLNEERNNALVVLDSLQELRIVPKHVVEPLMGRLGHDFNAFLKERFDQSPVISGPYQLHSYSGEKIVTVRRDDYWGNAALHDGKLPGPKYVIHPVYKANDHYSVALQQGRLDASSNFIPRIWLKARKGVRAWYDEAPYFVSTSMPMLLINHTRDKLKNPALRRAMAFAINYKDIQELAVSGYSEELQPGLVLPFGPESKYFNQPDARKYGASYYDPQRAKRTLKDAGYTSVFDDAGTLLETRDSNGKRIPTIYLKSAAGWNDWEAIVRIAVKGMREVGIDARERFVDGSLFWNATVTGDFDLIMNTPASPPSPSKPWSRFEAVLTSDGFKPLGEKMYKNQGRFNDPTSSDYDARFDQLLASIPKLTQEEQRIAAYRELNRLFMQLQPALPVVYRPHNFYQFSEKHWTGFATASNPYLPPAIPSEGLGTEMLWRLRPTERDN